MGNFESVNVISKLRMEYILLKISWLKFNLVKKNITMFPTFELTKQKNWVQTI